MSQLKCLKGLRTGVSPTELTVSSPSMMLLLLHSGFFLIRRNKISRNILFSSYRAYLVNHCSPFYSTFRFLAQNILNDCVRGWWPRDESSWLSARLGRTLGSWALRPGDAGLSILLCLPPCFGVCTSSQRIQMHWPCLQSSESPLILTCVSPQHHS